jgi:SSS family solute:Na+ symporter
MSIRTPDLLVLLAYLAGMWAVAFYFARRNTSTEQYFLGGRSFPGWALGMSMMATSVSSVTFLAFPAAAFAGDLRDLVINLMLPIGIVFALLIYIPLFRRGRITSAYEYLGTRFGPIVRLYGTISFMLLRICWLGVILCLISNVIVVLTGFPTIPVIIVMGIFVAVYTIVGGIEAVVWTDVLQGIILLAGGLFSLVCLATDLPGGMGQIFEIGLAHDKFGMGPANFNLNERTIWTAIVLGVFTWIAYQTEQNLVQRYIAASSTREARKATLIYGVIALPTWAFFFFVGVCLFVYFQVLPDEKVQSLTPEQVFPYFILTRLPPGVAGLVIAGVLSAAMSSVDSTLNAISTVTIVDIVKPYLVKGRSDRLYLALARGIAAVAALLMIGLAIAFSRIPTHTINELDWAIGSIFAGCIMGVFMLGFFTTRVDYAAALVGMAVAVLLNIYLVLGVVGWIPPSLAIPVHKFWIGPLVNVVFMVVAYGAGCLRPRKLDQLAGLTIWTLERGNGGSS